MFILLVAVLLQPIEIIDTVDLSEHNSYYDPTGRHVFDQMIFYDWDGRNARHQVIDWRLAGDNKMHVRRDWKNRRTIIEFQDGDTMRKVVSQIHIRTFTDYDPELLERDYIPREKRRGLSK